MSSIGRRIREVRVAKGITQSALACDGISAGYVSLVESGKRMPSDQMIERFALRLGVSVSDLRGSETPCAAPGYGRPELNFARLALANGNPDEAIRTLDALDQTVVDPALAAEAGLVIAESLQQLGLLDRAISALEEVVVNAEHASSWVTMAVAATTLTVMYLEFGDVNRAVEVAQAAMDKVEKAGLSGTDEHIRLGATLVAAASERGDRLYATHRIEALIRIADRHSTTRARGSVYWNAGVIAHRRGRQDDAIRLTDRAVALLGEQEESRDLPRLRMHYAWLLVNADEPDPEAAMHQLDLAESDDSLNGSQLDRGERAILRGRAYLLLGQLYEAAENAATALQLLGPSDHVERAGALLLLGDVGIAQFDESLARDSFCEMELVLRGMNASREVARLWRELGDSLRAFGDMPSAVSAYDSSLSMLGMAKSSTSGRVAQPTR